MTQHHQPIPKRIEERFPILRAVRAGEIEACFTQMRQRYLAAYPQLSEARGGELAAARIAWLAIEEAGALDAELAALDQQGAQLSPDQDQVDDLFIWFMRTNPVLRPQLIALSGTRTLMRDVEDLQYQRCIFPYPDDAAPTS